MLVTKDMEVLYTYPAGKPGAAYVIPDSVAVIRGDAFDGCTSLADIYYTGTETQWNDMGKYGSGLDSDIRVHYNCR